MGGGGAGLNRTSVGLKLRDPDPAAGAQPLPQSNQRGIETIAQKARAPGIHLCLNRTSVGLKPGRLGRILAARDGLNRTSVGLKRRLCGGGTIECLRCLNRTSVGLKQDAGIESILPQ